MVSPPPEIRGVDSGREYVGGKLVAWAENAASLCSIFNPGNVNRTPILNAITEQFGMSG